MSKYVIMKIRNKPTNIDPDTSVDVYLKDRDGFSLICETPNKPSAILIAKALNAHGPAIRTRTRKVKKLESLLANTTKEKDKNK